MYINFIQLNTNTLHIPFTSLSLSLLFRLNALIVLKHKYFFILSLSLPLSSNRMLSWEAGRAVVFFFGWGSSPVPAQAHCLHSGVMDPAAADTSHISASCPVPWGRTIIVRLRTAMATPYMARRGWLITCLLENTALFFQWRRLRLAARVAWLTDFRVSLTAAQQGIKKMLILMIDFWSFGVCLCLLFLSADVSLSRIQIHKIIYPCGAI